MLRFIADAYLAAALALTDGAKPWADQALATPGYSPARLGHDLWLTSAGHGAGFWDRDELDTPPAGPLQAPLLDRNGKPYSPEPGASLGDCLTAACYGTRTAIAPGAYCEAYTARGWLYLV